MSCLPSRTHLVHFVLKYVEVVGGGDSDDVLLWVPRGVLDLLVEVQTVYADLVLLPLPPGGHLASLQDGPRFTVLPRGLQRDVPPRVPVKHPEEVVVRARHDGTGEEEQQNKVNCTSQKCLQLQSDFGSFKSAI